MVEQVLDRQHLARYTGGDRALECEIFEIYLQEADSQIERLANGGNGQERRIAAHSLKGAARSLGAQRLARAAERAEALLVNPARPPADVEWQAAMVAVSKAAAELRHHLVDALETA